MSVRPFGLICVFSAAAVLACSGCGGGGGANCGDALKIPPGNNGGSYGGTYYPKVKGGPVVSLAGKGTSCEALLALADAFDNKSGTALISWLDKNGWTWMNNDQQASNFMNFNGSNFEVFVGTPPAKEGVNASQVGFPVG